MSDKDLIGLSIICATIIIVVTIISKCDRWDSHDSKPFIQVEKTK